MSQHQRSNLTAFLLLLAVSANAQEQLDAPGFESWTNAGSATQEPVEWSSLKTSDGGVFLNAVVPQLCWRSSDAHSGSYSVELRTVGSAIGPANGLLTNGRVHAELDVANSYMFTDQGEEQWRTSLASRPDSLVGWFKASPALGDRANVGALLHVGDGRLPAFGTEANYVAGASWKAPFGTVSDWTRFSTPFQYLDDRVPEWVLLILTSGDSAGSMIGTKVWFDDLALIYNVHCTASVSEGELQPGQPTDLLVSYATGGAPTAPIQFSVELSDAQGSFEQATVIGSVVSSAAQGVVPCTIPAGVPPGAGYRIRVVTASPYFASVPASLPLYAATAIAGYPSARDLVRMERGRLMIDLRAQVWEDPLLEVFDAQGRLVHRQRPAIGVLNELGVQVHGAVLIIRLAHRSGVWSGKVALP